MQQSSINAYRVDPTSIFVEARNRWGTGLGSVPHDPTGPSHLVTAIHAERIRSALAIVNSTSCAPALECSRAGPGAFTPPSSGSACLPPSAIVDRLADIAADLARDQDIRKRMTQFGSTAVANHPDQFAKMLREETTQWASLVKQLGLK
jgi:hypothetical protein